MLIMYLLCAYYVLIMCIMYLKYSFFMLYFMYCSADKPFVASTEECKDLIFSVGGKVKGHPFKLQLPEGRPVFFMPADNDVSFADVGCCPLLTVDIISRQVMDYIKNLPSDAHDEDDLRKLYYRFLKPLPFSYKKYIFKMEYTVTITPPSDSGLKRYVIGCHRQYYKYRYSDGGPISKER